MKSLQMIMQYWERVRPRRTAKWSQLIALVAIFSVVAIAHASRAAAKQGVEKILEISLPEEEPHTYSDYASYNKITGIPATLAQVNYPVEGNSMEEKALQYLRDNSVLLGLSDPYLADLVHIATRDGLSGTTVRFRQFAHGVPVYRGEIVVHINRRDEVSFVSSSYRPDLPAFDAAPLVTPAEARTLAHDHLAAIPPFSHDTTALTIYDLNGMTRLAYQVRVDGTEPAGNWEVLVDANSGELFKVANNAYYNVVFRPNTLPDHQLSAPMVDGVGNVFDPDPLTSATAVYGTGGYVDNNDANSSDLTAELMSVTLPDIQFSGGTYTLIGPYAEIFDFEAPFNGNFSQPSSTFNFNRFDDAFEAVVTYYHIDASMRYLNLTLGISVMPYQYNGGVRFDPHGLNGADNSHYTAGRVAFGEGGVDDAEDSDVIHHELGHGLHDWITSGGLSQVNGLSEGVGDYWAQSYNRSIDSWTPSDPQWNWVFRWDGHNPFWGGRVTNWPNLWPGGLTGSIHTDGQIWSTANMQVWDAIGKTKTDIAFWEGLAQTGPGTNQSQAANAVYQAAIDMGYSLTDLNAMHSIYSARGYVMPPPPVPDFALEASPTNQEICTGEDAVYTVSVQQLLGYSGVVNLSASGHPPGTTPAFSPNGNPAPYTSTLTINNTAWAASGSYMVDIAGMSPTRTHTTTVNLDVSTTPSAITLVSPADGATGQPLTPTFTWQADAAAGAYTLEVATDSGFSNIVLSVPGIAGTSYTPAAPLEGNTTYFWRVHGVNSCGAGGYSAVFSFQTESSDSLLYLPLISKQ